MKAEGRVLHGIKVEGPKLGFFHIWYFGITPSPLKANDEAGLQTSGFSESARISSCHFPFFKIDRASEKQRAFDYIIAGTNTNYEGVLAEGKITE